MRTQLLKRAFYALLCGAMLCAAAPLYGQVTLVRGAKPRSRIVVTTPSKADSTAAALLQEFVRRISDATLPIVEETTSTKLRRGDVVIGNGLDNTPFVSDRLREDGFLVTVDRDVLRIVSGGDKGSIYGVVTLLEKVLGVQYWGENEYSLTRSRDIEIPQTEIAENPAFRYRQSQFYGMRNDPIYKHWMRLEEPRETFVASYWVHTFDRLLPSARYGAEHPEYYSYFKGKRHPGKASQWCLSNPEVFEIVAARLDSLFRAHPDLKMISVSQNDGNYTNCQCDACRATDEYEGALSGSVIHFLNRLAERFPDKEFSTLAYLYTMQPPRHVKPLPNVNIMLCDIDCNREVSLTENASGREFMRALKGWSAITQNIFVWDYGINFDNFVAPFPNFHILGENIRTFRDHGVNMHFSQIAGSRGGDFAEMRTWIVSKLMWNPEADVDALMKEFMEGYYGAAAPHLYHYVQLITGALIGSGNRLWIYDSPVSHKRGMLKPTLMRRYKELFDRAEAAVAGDSILLARVQRSRLPLLYSELELARTEPDKDFDDLTRKLDHFEAEARRFNVPTLNERSNHPVDYCNLFRSRYMPSKEQSLALGAQVNYIDAPERGYAELGRAALTDGLFGGAGYVESWVGWEGRDAAMIIDLGEVKGITTVETDFLHQLGHWVLLPKQVRYSISTDGEHFTEAGVYDLDEERAAQIKFVGVKHTFAEQTPVRYIRIDVVGTKTCPHWHYGVGHPCWFFIDEVTVL